MQSLCRSNRLALTISAHCVNRNVTRSSSALSIRSPNSLLSRPIPARQSLGPCTAAGARALHKCAASMAPRDEPNDVADEAALLEAFSEIPTVSGAWIHPAGAGVSTLTVQSSQRNVAANAQRKFLTHFSLPDAYGGELLQPSFPAELKDVSLLSVSPSGKRTLVVRAGEEGKSASLEVWGGGRLLKELQVPKALHGGVYNDGWFGAGAAWAPDESRLAYVAEAPPRTRTPLWGDSAAAAKSSNKPQADSGGGSKDGDASRRKSEGGEEKAGVRTWRGVADFQKHRRELNSGKKPPALSVLDLAAVADGIGHNSTASWRILVPRPGAEPGSHTHDSQEDWGEVNTGKKPPALFVLDLASWRLAPVAGLPPDSSVGQPVWAPQGDALVCVVWPHTAPNFPAFPQRLGIVYCFNRPCALWAAPAPDTSAEKSGDGASSGASNGSPAADAGAQPAGDAESAGSAGRRPGEGTEQQQEGQQEQPAAVRLTPAAQLQSAFSPRFAPDGRRLVFLSQHAACVSGVHNGTTSVQSLDWPQGDSGWDAAKAAEASNAADVLPVVQASSGSDFPGLYALGLPLAPFLGGERLVANTQWRSSAAIVGVPLASGTVERLSPDDGAAWSLLDHRNGWLVASSSRPGAPPSVHVARASDAPPGSAAALHWQQVRAGDGVAFDERVEAALSDIETVTLDVRVPAQSALASSQLRSLGCYVAAGAGGGRQGSQIALSQTVVVCLKQLVPAEGDEGQRVPFQAVVVRPRSAAGPSATVLLPHGGPHSAYVASYVSAVAYLTALGYAIVAPNFRGSTGFGEACVQALPGRAGTDDVADCLTALQACIDKGWTDPKRVAVVGGSHGGFLTGHLVGQHPDRFAAAVLRNPVLDISAMIHLSDIPDWCYVEAWGTQEGKRRMAARPSAEDLDRFRAVSPIAHVDAVTAPLLFLLGAKDRRVPLTDAQLYVRALKSRGKDAPETKVIVFPEDTHALDRAQTEFEQWVSVAAWLKRHLPASRPAAPGGMHVIASQQ